MVPELQQQDCWTASHTHTHTHTHDTHRHTHTLTHTHTLSKSNYHKSFLHYISAECNTSILPESRYVKIACLSTCVCVYSYQVTTDLRQDIAHSESLKVFTISQGLRNIDHFVRFAQGIKTTKLRCKTASVTSLSANWQHRPKNFQSKNWKKTLLLALTHLIHKLEQDSLLWKVWPNSKPGLNWWQYIYMSCKNSVLQTTGSKLSCTSLHMKSIRDQEFILDSQRIKVKLLYTAELEK